MNSATTNILYVNNCGDISIVENEIVNACKNGGELPSDLEDTFTLTEATCFNADGSTRYVLNWA